MNLTKRMLAAGVDYKKYVDSCNGTLRHVIYTANR